ncbi:MAG: phosphoribosyltransferase, partial [Hyphomicrobiales bacterium]|nr:phosphoribosyltransferase [Hyphomicrobiales bacterium]
KHRKAARIIFAVPVAPPETIEQLRTMVDEVVCLQTPTPFVSVGQHYESFGQVSDDEVIALLDAYHEPAGSSEI